MSVIHLGAHPFWPDATRPRRIVCRDCRAGPTDGALLRKIGWALLCTHCLTRRGEWLKTHLRTEQTHG